MRVVLPVESDVTVFQADQSLITDRYTASVPGPVFQDLLRSTPWRFCVHDPLGSSAGRELKLEVARVCQRGKLPMERKPPAVEGTTKQSQELAAKHAAKHAHRQEESRPAGDPTRAIRSQATSRHDAMHMRMVLKVLTPGVEDGQEADLSPEVLGVGGDLP